MKLNFFNAKKLFFTIFPAQETISGKFFFFEMIMINSQYFEHFMQEEDEACMMHETNCWLGS